MLSFVDEYLASLKYERNLSDNTVSAYRRDLVSFIEFIEEKNISDVSNITSEHLSDFFETIKKIRQNHLRQENFLR
jgi:integrase/recombinase XerD